MSSRAIIVFLKAPIPGKVKTRIGREVGHEKAVRIYSKLLQISGAVLAETDAAKLRYFSPAPFALEGWPMKHTEDFLQEGEDLGARMHSAFQEALQNYDRVLIVGTDCPYLTKAIIDDAFKMLLTYDVVIGPSLDGGYYLLGMTKTTPELFMDMPWSTDQVFPRTVELLNEMGKSYELLPTLSDIDYISDWETYQQVH